MTAVQAVHATGINWLGIAPILIAVIVAVGGAAKWIISRIDQNRDRTEKFVTQKVDDTTKSLTAMTNVLAGRLDKVDTHLAEQDKTQVGVIERVARIEGKLNGTSQR